MNYSVSWTDAATDALAEIWLNASDRNDIVAAGDRLDRSLARDPLGIGESRIGATRFVYESPLAVLYDVDGVGHTVKVWHVWRPF
jgi:hypothetical protein